MLPFYERFIRRFPTIRDLADAPLDDVLTLWAGMGYYARARNLHHAAQIVRDQYGGVLPDTAEELRRLPGIGEYTAGAIASIAFGREEPAVDGNVRRVYARLFIAEDTAPAADWVRQCMVQASREEGAAAGAITEALMELGALVCLPKGARCGQCPLEMECKAKQNDAVSRYPIKSEKAKKIVEIKDILIDQDENGQYLLRKRTERLLHKMYEFPDETTLYVDGFAVEKLELWLETEFVFTHRVWRMKGWRTRVTDPVPLPEEYGRFSKEELGKLAIPAAMKAFVEVLD